MLKKLSPPIIAVIAAGLLAIAGTAFVSSSKKEVISSDKKEKSHKLATATYQYNLDVTDQAHEDDPANYSKVTGGGPTCVGSTAICTIVAPVPSPDNGRPDFSSVNSMHPVRNNSSITNLTFKP
jgi:hypothetical protein